MTQTDLLTDLSNQPPGSHRNDDRPRRRAVDHARLGKLFEKLPPHAIEAEMSLLGAMMVEPAVIGEVVQILRDGSDFFNTSHGVIYDTVVELYDRNSTVDLVQLHQRLIDRGQLENLGGQEYLLDLVENVPAVGHATHYAKLVREKAIVRQLIAVSGEILHDAYTSPEEAQAILDGAEQRIFSIAERYESGDYVSLEGLLEQTMDWVWDRKMPTRGVRTRFADLDSMTGGLQPGELIILAARPSMGKTALALNIAEQISDQGLPVGLFSLEMSKEQLVYRLVAARARVDMQKMLRNMLNDDERHHVKDACADLLQRTKVYVDDTASLSLLQLRAKARRMAAKHEISCVLVDYLQLITSGTRAESRQIEVSEISRGLKALARELGVPVVCLSQLNRGPEQREGHKPRLSDLRESGSIEQDADVVLLLHREDYYHKDDENWEPTGVAELIVAKQRNGPTGLVKLAWDAACTRFRDAVHTGYDDPTY